MSGPKVISVVTREELIALGQRDLAKVERVRRAWEKRLMAHGSLNSDDVVAVKERVEKLHALLDIDQFDELRRQCDMEIDFLKKDIDTRVEKEAIRGANRRTGTQRLSATAETLLGRLKDQPSKRSSDLVRKLTEIAHGKQTDLASCNSVFNEVFTALSMDSESIQQVATSAQRELAEALGADESKEITLQEWLAHSGSERESLQGRINLDIARLESEFGSEAAQPFVKRLEEVMEHGSVRHQRMMADTLSIDLAKEWNFRKKTAQLLLELDVVEGELSVYDSEEVSAAFRAIDLARELTKDIELESAIKQAQRVLATVSAKYAADRSRAAVLAELKNLGYDVQEGMLAQLATDNQMVLVNPTDANYGVELTTPPGNKMQVRAVALSNAANANAGKIEKSIEDVWCGDLKNVSKALQAQGDSLIIELAKDAGVIPLKVVSNETMRETESVVTTPPKVRYMRPPSQ